MNLDHLVSESKEVIKNYWGGIKKETTGEVIKNYWGSYQKLLGWYQKDPTQICSPLVKMRLFEHQKEKDCNILC